MGLHGTKHNIIPCYEPLSQSVHLRQSQTQILTYINIENSLVINILIIGLKITTSKIILVDGCLNLHEELLKH